MSVLENCKNLLEMYHIEKIRCQIHGVTLLGFLSFLAAKLYHTKKPSVLKYLSILVLAEAYLGKSY